MLNPNNDRLDYGQIIAPPADYNLDFAIGTTYSLDDFKDNLKFDKGLYSTDGFATLDDSKSLILDDTIKCDSPVSILYFEIPSNPSLVTKYINPS